MGFWDRFFGRQEKNAPLQTQRTLGEILRQVDSPRRGTKELLEAYRESPWLHAVTRKIAESLSAVPWTLHVVQNSRNGSRRAVRASQIANAGPSYRRKMLARAKSSDNLREIPEHPFLDLLNNPNPQMTGLQARMVTSLHLDLKGESFWLFVLDGAGRPIEYWPIPSHYIQRLPSQDNPFYEITGLGAERIIAPADCVLWQRYVDPADPYGRGTGTGEALNDEIDTDIALSQTVKAGFHNRALPELFIAIKGIESQEQMDAIATKFKDRHRGIQRARNVHFHTGDMSVERLSQTFEEMQALDMRGWERDAFRSAYGVPPELLGLTESSNRATAQEARRIFAEQVLVPRLEAMRAEFQEKLIPFWDDRLIVDYESPVPGDWEAHAAAATTAPWALTRGEWRVMAGQEHRGPIDDVHIMNVGLVEVPVGTSLADAMPEGPVQDPDLTAPDAPDVDAPDVDAPTPPAVEESRSMRKARLTKAGEGTAEAALAALTPDRLNNAVLPEWEAQIEAWGTGVLQGVGVSGQSFNMLNPLVVDHLEDVATKRIVGLTNETTRQVLRAQIIEGVQAGEGFKDVAKRVQAVFTDADTHRARTIARTEVGRSANFATHQAHMQSGVVELRQWVPTPDDRVREEHLALGAEDQIVGIGEPFRLGGLEAMYPGDFGDPAHDINCRCTTIAIIPQPPEDLGDLDEFFADTRPKSAKELKEVWIKAFESPADEWEEAATRALRKGFALQEKDVLEALKKVMGGQ